MLQVVQVPDPAPGADWSAVVPGINLWDVTGVTAVLTTVSFAAQPVDVSGNGNTGTYVGSVPTFVPGAVVGDTAADFGVAPTTGGIDLPTSAVDVTGSVSGAWWLRWPIDLAGVYLGSFYGDLLFGTRQWAAGLESDIPGQWVLRLDGQNYSYEVANFAFPNDGNWHSIGFSYNAGTHVGKLFFDGAPVALTQNIMGGPNAGPLGVLSYGRQYSTNSPQPVGALDEMSLFNADLSNASHAAIFAAGPGGFAAYTALVMGLAPETYYHLDAPAASTGREPTLLVSNGTNDVIAIPPGFPATSNPGPYTYAWQPNLNADAQSTDGKLTTVAIPRLLVPAGYVVSSRTPDILPGDQWSQVAIWWDDAYEHLVGPIPPYAYPPGAHLVYQQTGP